MFDVSVVMRFRCEGPAAQQSLNAVRRCASVAVSEGRSVEVVAVLDGAPPETARIVSSHGGIRVLRSDAQDFGEAINAGVRASAGECIAIIEGGDYWSANWLAACFPLLRPGVVLRQEWVVSFGERREFMQQVSQTDPLFDADTLLVFNPYAPSFLAPREVIETCPFRPTRLEETGYGFEDWRWLCETVSAGVVHEVVPGTALFRRRHASDAEGRGTMGPTSLFSPRGIGASG